jgi:hypothetical protein
VQDFGKKMTIVLREDLGSWQLTNTIGHIAAYLGNKMREPFDTGESFVTKDGKKIPRNSQFPSVALKATPQELKEISVKLETSGVLWVIYTPEMIEMINDDELSRAISQITCDELNILGIGLFGAKDKLKELTGSLKLWK